MLHQPHCGIPANRGNLLEEGFALQAAKGQDRNSLWMEHQENQAEVETTLQVAALQIPNSSTEETDTSSCHAP